MSDYPYLRAAGIGMLAGSRSMTAPAAVLAGGESHWTGLVTTLAAGELIADKLPFTPSRLSPPVFAERIVVSALCGSALASRYGASRAAGAALGAAGGALGTWIFTTLRGAIAKAGVPDFLVAVAEDALAVSGSKLVAGAP